MSQQALIGIFAALGTFILVILAIAIVLYILKSIGLYKLAVNAGIENAWLSWLPIGDTYIIAKLVVNVKIGNWQINNLPLILTLGVVLIPVAGLIPFIGTLYAIAYAILYYFALYKLYNTYRPQSATLWLVLSILLSFMMPIFVFVMRDDKPVQPAQ